MALYVGDTPIKRVYHGDTPIKKIYYGDTLVWSAFDGVPTGLSSSRTRNSFTPSWNNVTDADGYDLRWSTNSDMTGATTVTGTTSGTPVTGLNASTTYYWQVRAKQGSILAPWSATQNVTTAAALTAPSRGAAPTPTGGIQQMQWVATAPADGGSAITAYDWRWRRVGAAGWTTVSNGGATFTRTGLAYGTQYEAQFKAKNTIGTAADWSPSGTGTTTAASAPARGAAPSANGGNQQVAWTATAPSNGGSAITHYLWRWRAVGAVSWRTTVTTTGRTFTRTGLTANTQYEAQFKARNSIGDAASWSPSGRATTDAVVLSVAAAPSVTIDPIPSGAPGTSVRLTRTITGGTYDGLDHAWLVGGGTLDDASAVSPTWTRPNTPGRVSVDLGVGARGTGTNARAGTRDSATAATVQAQVVSVTPAISQTFVPDSAVNNGNTASLRNAALNFSAQIDSDLLPENAGAAYLFRIFVQAPVSSQYRLSINVANTQFPASNQDLVRRDLSPAFETGWRINIAVGSSSWTFNAADFGSDASEPYSFVTTNSTAQSNLIAAFNAIIGSIATPSNISVTLSVP